MCFSCLFSSVLQCCYINYELVFYIVFQYVFIGGVDFVYVDYFDIGDDVVFGVEVEYVLGFFDVFDQ